MNAALLYLSWPDIAPTDHDTNQVEKFLKESLFLYKFYKLAKEISLVLRK